MCDGEVEQRIGEDRKDATRVGETAERIVGIVLSDLDSVYVDLQPEEGH